MLHWSLPLIKLMLMSRDMLLENNFPEQVIKMKNKSSQAWEYGHYLKSGVVKKETLSLISQPSHPNT